MTNALADDLPPRTHNAPPIREVILEALTPFLGRKNDLLQVAETAVIVDDESAAKCIDLAGLIGALGKEIDAVRVEMKAPHLVATRAIDASFGAALQPLVAAGQSLRGMLTAYERKRAAEAEATRQTALAEQRRREEEAAAAAERARQTTSLPDALASLKAQEEAAAAARRADAIRPEPVRAQLGSLGTQRSVAFDVTDMRKLLGWILKQPMRGTLETEVRKLLGSYLRQIGVESVARGVEIPGLAVRIETSAAIRR